MSGQQYVIHDSDSEISENGLTVVEPVLPCPQTPLRPVALTPQVQHTLIAPPVQAPLAQPVPAPIQQQVASFLSSEAGAALMTELNQRHNVELQQAATQATDAVQRQHAVQAMAGVPAAGVPEAAAPPVQAPPAPSPPVQQPTPTARRSTTSSHPHWRRTQQVPVGVQQVPAPAPQLHPQNAVSPEDEAECKRVMGDYASLVRPTRGHTSRAGMVRYGNATEHSWWCRTCEQKLLAIRRKGDLLGAPIYLYNILPCDGSADPPSKGAPSEKVKARAHRTPTPPYPFLVPLAKQTRPPPIDSGKVAMTGQTPTHTPMAAHGSRVQAKQQLEHLVAVGRHSGIPESEPVMTGGSASSTTPAPPVPPAPQPAPQPSGTCLDGLTLDQRAALQHLIDAGLLGSGRSQ